MTPIETAEREVIEAAKAWAKAAGTSTASTLLARLFEAVGLLEDRERVAIEAGAFCCECQKIGSGHNEGCVMLRPIQKSTQASITTNSPDVTIVRSSVPPPRPGAEPIVRKPKKLSKRAQAIEARRQSDQSGLAAGRDNIDYGSDDLPTPR